MGRKSREDKMPTENIRFQISAILVLIIILVVYGRSKKLPLVSKKWFTVLLISTCANMVFDLLSVYSISHLDLVSPDLRLLCHQLFIGTLNLSIMCLYFYIAYLGKHEQKPTFMQFFIRTLPFIVATAYVFFGEIYYTHNGDTLYSYGPMVTALYVS